MKYKFICLFALATILFSFQSKKKNLSESPGSLTYIDVLQAFNTEKSFKMSEMVKEVEIVQFETSSDAYFQNASSSTIGKKYILIADNGNNRVILFDRQGKFIRHIGRKGKGPGEFNRVKYVVMDPAEKFIFIAGVFAHF